MAAESRNVSLQIDTSVRVSKVWRQVGVLRGGGGSEGGRGPLLK